MHYNKIMWQRYIPYILQGLWWLFLLLFGNWIVKRFGNQFNSRLDRLLKNFMPKYILKKVVIFILLYSVLLSGVYVSNLIYNHFNYKKTLINRLNVIDKYVLLMVYQGELPIDEKKVSLIKTFNEEYVYMFNTTLIQQSLLSLSSKQLIILLKGDAGPGGKFSATWRISPYGQEVVEAMLPSFLKEIEQIMKLEKKYEETKDD